MNEKVMIFVDGANLNISAIQISNKKYGVDYESLKKNLNEFLESKGFQLIRPYYYVADDKRAGLRKFFDRLQFFGYDVRLVDISKPYMEYEGADSLVNLRVKVGRKMEEEETTNLKYFLKTQFDSQGMNENSMCLNDVVSTFDANGYTLELEDVKLLPVDKHKGVDILIATEMLYFGFCNNYDVAVLCSGDQDFIPMIKAVKDMGKRVYVAAFDHSCAEKMKRIPDGYISLSSNFGKIKRQIRNV